MSTDDGGSYVSEAVKVLKTPAIDSLHVGIRSQVGVDNENEQSVVIYVDTHDPDNNTWYYRWEWEQTWEVLVPNPSYYRMERKCYEEPDFNKVRKTAINFGGVEEIVDGWIKEAKDYLRGKSLQEAA